MRTGAGTPRVLWVIPTISSSFGGPTTTAVNGVIAETRAGLRAELIATVSRDGDPGVEPAAERLSRNGVKFRLFARTALTSKGEAWGLSPQLVLWMIRNFRSYDVIHLQYVWCLSSIAGAVLARLFRIPLVITPHESLTDYDIDIASKSRLKRGVKLALRRLFLASADRLVLMSQLEERDTRFGETPVQIIPHAVLEHEVPEPDPGSRTDPTGLRIGFLGRNIEKKGIDLIVEALGRNPERDWSLKIAGPPGTASFISGIDHRIAQLGVGDKVTWLGFLDQRGSLFDLCDVLAMPSAYEGFGMVSAEAMCAGVPVIVPRLSGVAEIVAEFDAGLVMPEASAEALGQALVELDDNPDKRRTYGRNGIRATNQRLTYKAYATATTALYESLTESS